MDQITGFHTAQAILDDTLAALSEGDWHRPTACTGWTAADIAGHATWGQDMLTAMVGGRPHDDRTGAPGAARPADYLRGTPLGAWRAARDRAGAVLTQDILDRPMPPGSAPGTDVPIDYIVSILEFDSVTHAWDIAAPRGLHLDVPDALLARVHDTAHRVIRREPGFFEAELTPAPDAGPLTALMAFCGREVRVPAR